MAKFPPNLVSCIVLTRQMVEVSVSMHSDFVAHALEELLRLGVIRVWDRHGPPITVINERN